MWKNTKKMNIKIVSGGQTGVDQGALEAAVQLGLEFGGWAPHGWLAEKPLGAIPAAYRAAMREYPDQGSNAQNYRERTKANVRDSHATLILVEKLPLEGGNEADEGFRRVDRTFAPCTCAATLSMSDPARGTSSRGAVQRGCLRRFGRTRTMAAS